MLKIVRNPYLCISAESAGQQLRNWRHMNSIKQDEVARLAGVTQAAVSRWENGHDIPSPPALRKLEEMFAQFQRDELKAERAIIEVQTSMRALFRLDGLVFKAASKGLAKQWPAFISHLGRPMEDHLVNEAATFLSVRENRRDLRLGKIVYVRGASQRHVEIGGPGMLHLWTACSRQVRNEAYIEMIYEPAPAGTRPEITEIFTL